MRDLINKYISLGKYHINKRMGCESSKGCKDMDIDNEWKSRKLPNISHTDFDNESEIIIYKTMNLIRMDP